MSGMNFICENKSKITFKQIQAMAKKWFHAECGERYGELHYRKSKPCILFEKYLGDDEGNYPVDYIGICIRWESSYCRDLCWAQRRHVLSFYMWIAIIEGRL